jgi:hypothetical protein
MTVDRERFDALARGLARGTSRRGAVAGLAALTGVGLSQLHETAAKKRKSKKKRCLRVRRPCRAGARKKCCAGLTCGDNECGGGDFCLRKLNGGCKGRCDCLGFLSCSERAGNRCQACSDLREGCPNGDDDCCRSAGACGNNGCVNNNDGDVCCLATPGATCASSCECCAGLGCDERAGFTCQTCVREASAEFTPADQEACSVDGDCCRADYVCGDSPGCQGTPAKVCCGLSQARCNSDCDCCGAFGNCANGACCQFPGGACIENDDCCAGLCLAGVCETG